MYNTVDSMVLKRHCHGDSAVGWSELLKYKIRISFLTYEMIAQRKNEIQFYLFLVIFPKRWEKNLKTNWPIFSSHISKTSASAS